MEQSDVHNIAEFMEMIKDLDSEIKKELMKKAANNIAKPLLDELKSRAPGKKDIKKSIGAKYNSEDNSIEIGARKGKHYAGFIAPWLEKGVGERHTKSNTGRKHTSKWYNRKRLAHSTGSLPKQEFFEPAVDAKLQETQQNIFDGLMKTYNQVVRKYERFYK
jgi:hypothetical protein